MNELRYKKLFTKFWPGQVTSIENSIASGTPDTVVSFDGAMAWIEFKTIHNRDIIVRPLQRNFIKKEFRVGGRVYISWHGETEPCMIRGETILEIDYKLKGGKLHYPVKELYPMYRGWDEIFSELTGKANVRDT